jgi:hypothetical protein
VRVSDYSCSGLLGHHGLVVKARTIIPIMRLIRHNGSSRSNDGTKLNAFLDFRMIHVKDGKVQNGIVAPIINKFSMWMLQFYLFML